MQSRFKKKRFHAFNTRKLFEVLTKTPVGQLYDPMRLSISLANLFDPRGIPRIGDNPLRESPTCRYRLPRSLRHIIFVMFSSSDLLQRIITFTFSFACPFRDFVISFLLRYFWQPFLSRCSSSPSEHGIEMDSGDVK
jgi:hypothetical protein